MWDIWEKRTGDINEKVVNKHIETNKTREQYQSGFATLSDYFLEARRFY